MNIFGKFIGTVKDVESEDIKMKENNIRKNGSGYFDSVAFSAMRNIEKEQDCYVDDHVDIEIPEDEREIRNEDIYVSKADVVRFHKTIKLLQDLAHLAGFSVEEHIILKDKKTGRVWK